MDRFYMVCVLIVVMKCMERTMNKFRLEITNTWTEYEAFTLLPALVIDLAPLDGGVYIWFGQFSIGIVWSKQ
jgi:hypothetical protein